MLRRWFPSRFVSIACSRHRLARPESNAVYLLSNRSLHFTSVLRADHAPLRKQLKDAARASRGKRDGEADERERVRQERLANWELTVGIEIHAQLNTGSKLFSREFFFPTVLYQPLT